MACAGGAAVWQVLLLLQQLQQQQQGQCQEPARTAAGPGGSTGAPYSSNALGVAWVPHRLVPPEEARVSGGGVAGRELGGVRGFGPCHRVHT